MSQKVEVSDGIKEKFIGSPLFFARKLLIPLKFFGRFICGLELWRFQIRVILLVARNRDQDDSFYQDLENSYFQDMVLENNHLSDMETGVDRYLLRLRLYLGFGFLEMRFVGIHALDWDVLLSEFEIV